MKDIFVTIELEDNTVISDFVQVFYRDREVESVEYNDRDITKLLDTDTMCTVQNELDEYLRADKVCGNDRNDR